MRKGILILGLILIIVGFLPVILELLGYGLYAAYFYLGFYSLMLAGFTFSELMLILIIVGVILLIVGAAA
ncbi:MAG: hypothetical protein ACFFAL_05155 [Promethearchaeota archaeon]